jgi:hypothetical protein
MTIQVELRTRLARFLILSGCLSLRERSIDPAHDLHCQRPLFSHSGGGIVRKRCREMKYREDTCCEVCEGGGACQVVR